MINKSIFSIHHKSLPKWQCARCNNGILNYIEELAISSETLESSVISENLHEPYWEVYFSYLLKCNHCKDKTTVAGTIYHYYVDGTNYEVLNSTYTIKYVDPSPRIIKYNSIAPDDVEKLLKLSFNLYWIDLHSCANKLRQIIEFILTDKKVKYATGLKNWIDNIESEHFYEYENVKLLMGSIKDIGNSASHSQNNEIMHEDILKSYAVLDHILEKSYVSNNDSIIAAAKELTEKYNKKKERKSAP